MGFILRAVLNLAVQGAEATVCGLIHEVAAWNNGPLGHLAHHPLHDPRTTLLIEDVQAHLARVDKVYDLILLDTDNGPDFLVRTGNTNLYRQSGLVTVANALATGGLAAFWSATVSAEFESRLSEQPWSWRREDIDLGPARQWGERFPARATAFAAEVAPAREVLAGSRSLKGGGAAGVATLGAAGVEVAQSVLAETQTAILPLVPYLDTLR